MKKRILVIDEIVKALLFMSNFVAL